MKNLILILFSIGLGTTSYSQEAKTSEKYITELFSFNFKIKTIDTNKKNEISFIFKDKTIAVFNIQSDNDSSLLLSPKNGTARLKIIELYQFEFDKKQKIQFTALKNGDKLIVFKYYNPHYVVEFDTLNIILSNNDTVNFFVTPKKDSVKICFIKNNGQKRDTLIALNNIYDKFKDFNFKIDSRNEEYKNKPSSAHIKALNILLYLDNKRYYVTSYDKYYNSRIDKLIYELSYE